MENRSVLVREQRRGAEGKWVAMKGQHEGSLW